MFVQEISIDIQTNINKDELIDEFSLLMSFYHGSGQTLSRIECQYISDNKIVCLPYTLEKKSLDNKFNNFYVNRQTKKIEELCNSNLEFKTIGKSSNSYKYPCKCKKPEYYILITNCLTIESPLTCGTCNKSVPLYRLPAFYDYGYMPILSWETNYTSCDRLQMNCEAGERWALNQMQEIKSELSKQGFGICRTLEQLTSIPVYYYLHNYKKFKADQSSKPCPSCNKKWGLKKQLHNFYDFKCDKCKIVSTTSLNS